MSILWFISFFKYFDVGTYQRSIIIIKKKNHNFIIYNNSLTNHKS